MTGHFGADVPGKASRGLVFVGESRAFQAEPRRRSGNQPLNGLPRKQRLEGRAWVRPDAQCAAPALVMSFMYALHSFSIELQAMPRSEAIWQRSS